MIHEHTVTTRRTSAINLRAFPAQRELIDRACQKTNKKLTDFILDAACREAEHVLCDRRYFVLDEDAFNAFEAALDVPLNKNLHGQLMFLNRLERVFSSSMLLTNRQRRFISDMVL